MNRRIAVSMRIVVSEYGEKRDALAQDWAKFLRTVLPQCLWVPLPNTGEEALDLAEKLGLNGLLLTGGDDWGRCPARDETERLLFSWAKRRGFPVGGICRGMQAINQMLGGDSAPVTDHVAVRHGVRFMDGHVAEVNSFHNNGIPPSLLASGLKTFAICENGDVEGFSHPRFPCFGIMWHPEREKTVAEHDRLLFHKFFGEM